MLNAIAIRWNEARATQLRKEFEDCMLRLMGLGEVVNYSARTNMLSAYNAVLENYGPLENLSAKAKKSAAKQLLKHAQSSFDMDMGRGHGLFLLSAYIESQALPGPEALYVKEAAQVMLDAAIEGVKNRE